MNKNEFLAHIRLNNEGERIIQTCAEHLDNSAYYAAESLKSINLYNTAYFSALHHDIGKLKDEFQKYLEKSFENQGNVSKSVIHTFAGVKYILEKYKNKSLSENDDYYALTSEILAYAVGAHHGLFDCINEKNINGFNHRLENSPSEDIDAINEFDKLYNNEKNRDIFSKSNCEIADIISKCSLLCSDDENDTEIAFMIGLLTRLISSAVMEGDRRDTAEFMSSITFPEYKYETMWNELLDKVENKLSKLDTSSLINQERRRISDICKNAANDLPGIYRLNVPTGGGKTLSSLRYALAHAAKYNKKRIIFTSPLLSILDQNSKIIREYIEDDDIILEHHSDVVIEDDTEKSCMHSFLCDTWASPVIITTLVQLLNTLFSSKSSSVRRFHTLTDSVIVIDEVQTVPNKILSLFNTTISFLANCCNATVVLCSATQPCLEKLKHPIRGLIKDIVPYDETLLNVFKRTQIKFSGGLKLSDVPEFAHNILIGAESMLIVCNKKSQSEYLFDFFDEEEYDVFYLSASLCSEHRKKTISEMYSSLENTNKKTICISTQVIEAGVDISFDSVIRFEAGLDSIIQSAGRCNRNGESSELKNVYVVRILDEDLTRLSDIKSSKDASDQLFIYYKDYSNRLNNDLMSDKSVEYYYTQLYQKLNQSGLFFDYKSDKHSATLYDMLSWNDCMTQNAEKEVEGYYLRQAFLTAGNIFSVFDNNTTDVIVPYGEGEYIISELLTERAKYDMIYAKELIKKAKQYTVSLYSYQIEKAKEYGAIIPIPLLNGVTFGLEKNFYDLQTGISMNFEKGVKECDILIL